jgi:hypothetical protein
MRNSKIAPFNTTWPRVSCYYIETARRDGSPQSRQSAKLFLQSLVLGLPQNSTRRRVCPSPFGSGGGAHSLAREGVETGEESQFQRGGIHWGTLFSTCTLCGSPCIALLSMVPWVMAAEGAIMAWVTAGKPAAAAAAAY